MYFNPPIRLIMAFCFQNAQLDEKDGKTPGKGKYRAQEGMPGPRNISCPQRKKEAGRFVRPHPGERNQYFMFSFFASALTMNGKAAEMTVIAIRIQSSGEPKNPFSRLSENCWNLRRRRGRVVVIKRWLTFGSAI